MVEAKITPKGCILLKVDIKPPKVRITSEGIGGKIFSIEINKKIPM
jgi:hypothetical protein